MQLPGRLARWKGDRQNSPLPGAPGTDASSPQPDLFRNLTVVFGLLAVLSAVLGLVGMRFGITILSSIYPGYRTIALSAALIWIVTGSILAMNSLRPLRGTAANAARVILGVIILIEVLELPFSVIGGHSGIETWLTGISAILLDPSASPISPVASGLILLAAVSLVFIVQDPGQSPENSRIRDAVGMCGSVIAIVSFTLVLSYVFGDPLLYGTQFIPIAAISVLAAFFLGIGLVTAAGPAAVPLRYITGDTIRARMLRTFVPLAVAIILVQQVVFFMISSHHIADDAILIAGSLVLFALVTGYVVSRISGTVGSALDRAEAALVQKNEDLGAMNEELMAMEEELRQNIEELGKSEQGLARSQMIAHLGSWDLDLVNNRLWWSDEVYRIFGLRPQEFNATYEAFLDAVHPEDRAAVDAAYSQSLREGRDSYTIDHRVIQKDTGKVRYVHEKCEHLRDETGKIIRSVGMVHDITERKRAELALQQNLEELSRREHELNEALAEKEVLLSEIHHRVKNNLSAFISLLSLEGSYDDSPAGITLKKDLQNRARSMALIHETLYRTRKYSTVEMDLYLKTLVGQITGTYALPGKLQVQVEADGIVLDLSRATTCGLIVNELVTNSFKYAFSAPFDCTDTGSRTCIIAVTLGEDGGKYVLRIRDNGIGLPAGFDARNARSLGLKLVNFLAKHQLRATVDVRSGPGTEFEISFPVNQQYRKDP